MGIENENLKFGNENLDFERYLRTLKKFFFFFGGVNWVNLVWLSWLSIGWVYVCGAKIAPYFFVSLFSFLFHLPLTFLPPLALFTFFFPLIFLLHLTIYAHKKHFSKLLHLPSSISINISLDLCVLSIFITHPFLVKLIFQNPFSLHQNGFFLQGIFFSWFSW